MQNDHELAAEIARAVGRLLMALRGSPALTGAALGDAADAAAHELIVSMLALHRPDDAVLSEESPADPARLGRQRLWIVDPLDGTREYREGTDRSDWAVHIALAVDGVPRACAVALPALNQVFHTGAAPRLPPASAGATKILVSRSRPPDIAVHVAQALNAELVPMGSAGAKAMAVLRGEAHGYLHAGGLHEWDSCAPVGVALASGLFAARIDGSRCVYNQADLSMPDLLVCRPEWAETLLAAIRASA